MLPSSRLAAVAGSKSEQIGRETAHLIDLAEISSGLRRQDLQRPRGCSDLQDVGCGRGKNQRIVIRRDVNAGRGLGEGKTLDAFLRFRVKYPDLRAGLLVRP